MIRFDQSVADASSFVLKETQRIAVDVDGASPGTPVEETAWSQQYARRRAARMAPASCSTSPGPAIVTEGTFGADGRELTLELRTVDDASFARAAAEQRLRFLPPFNMGMETPAQQI